jgi:hypothetical protein
VESTLGWRPRQARELTQPGTTDLALGDRLDSTNRQLEVSTGEGRNWLSSMEGREGREVGGLLAGEGWDWENRSSSLSVTRPLDSTWARASSMAS